MPKKANLQNNTAQRDDYPVDLITRSAKLSFDGSTINEEKRTVEAIIATAVPVTVVDRTRWEFVDEILDIDGMDMPESRQVPLLDNHSRYEISDIVGSAREIQKKDGVARGLINFSTLSEDAWTLVKERHLTDVSAGYRIYPDSSIYIERGCEAEIKGRKIKNSGERTLVYRTKWKLQEVSLTPIGADENAKMRNKPQGNEINRNENNNSQGVDMPDEVAKPVTEVRTETPANPAITQEKIDEAATRKAVEMAERSTTGKKNVADKAKLMGLTEDEGRSAMEGLTFFDKDHERTATEKLFEIQRKKIEKNAVPASAIESVRVHVDGFDNFRKAASLAIYQTAGGTMTDAERAEVKKTAYGGLTVLSCMRAFLDMNGVRGAGWMSPIAVYNKCVDMRRSFAITGGDLANVFLDVASKDMARGYAETPGVHELLCGRDTAQNFLPKYSISVSNLGDLEELKTGEGFPMTSMSDSKESVQLKIYALAIILDWKAIVNDSLGALVGMPAQLGASCRRTEEMLFWTFFYGTNMVGPTMGEDSTAMFTAGHRNFIGRGLTGVGAPTTTTIAAGRKAMMRQQLLAPDGRASTQYMNLPPKYIIAHTNLETAIKQRITSSFDIDSSATSNAAGVPNLDYIRGLIPVQSPYLDAKMDAATNAHNGWYLMADPRQAPAINKVFLSGMEAPTLRQKNSDVAEPLGTIYDIYHVVNFGQVNYRPVYANYGADQ
ncbi:hypothetical protein [Sulfuricurvum sp.]|uniref:phage major capsid protein n=1 Tax=Sulfuricurvum sp. TaxID=2025608 RepID=UPI0035683F2C